MRGAPATNGALLRATVPRTLALSSDVLCSTHVAANGCALLLEENPLLFYRLQALHELTQVHLFLLDIAQPGLGILGHSTRALT